MYELLKQMYNEVERISKRTGKYVLPPYIADSPCYYCELPEPGPKGCCKYCIQNPDSVVYDLIKRK